MKTSIKNFVSTFFLFLFFVNTIFASDSIIWNVDNLDTIGGFPVTVIGNPKIIESELGKAVEFDGIDDGMFINSNPVAGADSFTVEIVFMPYPGGGAEQRFLHIQQDENNRMLIELRSTNTDQWYIDTFIKSPSSNKTLVDPANLHPNSQWHVAALVYANGEMRHYIDGELELTGSVNYLKQSTGISSLGVRQNKVSWYKGAIQKVRVSHRALLPTELYKIDKKTSKVTTLLNQNSEGIKIFPLAFSNTDKNGILKLEVEQAGKLSTNIYALDAHKIMAIEKQLSGAGLHEIPIDLSNLSAGLYILVVNYNGITRAQKIKVDR